jgi:hypothetical protein
VIVSRDLVMQTYWSTGLGHAEAVQASALQLGIAPEAVEETVAIVAQEFSSALERFLAEQEEC